jgi:hypothetical protein
MCKKVSIRFLHELLIKQALLAGSNTLVAIYRSPINLWGFYLAIASKQATLVLLGGSFLERK